MGAIVIQGVFPRKWSFVEKGARLPGRPSLVSSLGTQPTECPIIARWLRVAQSQTQRSVAPPLASLPKTLLALLP